MFRPTFFKLGLLHAHGSILGILFRLSISFFERLIIPNTSCRANAPLLLPKKMHGLGVATAHYPLNLGRPTELGVPSDHRSRPSLGQAMPDAELRRVCLRLP